MKQFCDDRDGCRHKALLTYFGETFEAGRCRGNCDNCARQARGEAADAPDPDWLVRGLPTAHTDAALSAMRIHTAYDIEFLVQGRALHSSLHLLTYEGAQAVRFQKVTCLYLLVSDGPMRWSLLTNGPALHLNAIWSMTDAGKCHATSWRTWVPVQQL